MLINKVTYTMMENKEPKSPLNKKFRAETIKHFNLKDEDLIDPKRRNVVQPDYVEKNKYDI